MAAQELGWDKPVGAQGSLCCWGPAVAGVEVKITGVDCCWGLWAAHFGVCCCHPKPLLAPLGLQQSQWPCVGAEGTVLAGCIWKLVWETVLPCCETQGNPMEWVCGSSAWVGLQCWPHPSQVTALISAVHKRYGLLKSSRWLFVSLLLCICVRSCLEQALCLLVACETVSSRKLQKYFMKCSNKNNHVVQPMQNNTFGLEQCMQFL